MSAFLVIGLAAATVRHAGVRIPVAHASSVRMVASETQTTRVKRNANMAKLQAGCARAQSLIGISYARACCSVVTVHQHSIMLLRSMTSP